MPSPRAGAHLSSTTASRTRSKSPWRRREKTATAYRRRLGAAALLVLVAVTARCTRSGPAESIRPETTLRIGVQEAGSEDELEGIRQLRQILSSEGLARIREDGRPEPRLAEGWTTSPDGL